MVAVAEAPSQVAHLDDTQVVDTGLPSPVVANVPPLAVAEAASPVADGIPSRAVAVEEQTHSAIAAGIEIPAANSFCWQVEPARTPVVAPETDVAAALEPPPAILVEAGAGRRNSVENRPLQAAPMAGQRPARLDT